MISVICGMCGEKLDHKWDGFTVIVEPCEECAVNNELLDEED